MNYYEVRFTLSPYSQQDAEILMALLAEIGFDSFVDTNDGVLAYIPEANYCQNQIELLLGNPILEKKSVSYSSQIIADQNWNTRWESNFEPIAVENLCRIRAPYHKPETGFRLEIVIEPKMAFGTGHHQTTWLMVRELFNLNVLNKVVLDMGCGTGILAIVAEKLGAKSITAIDNDAWAFENAKENVKNNGCTRTEVILGNASTLDSMAFDIILANINLNILLGDMQAYSKCIRKSGFLILSGVLTADITSLSDKAKELGFQPIIEKSRDDWALFGLEKL